MARIKLSKPPTYSKAKRFPAFKGWLEENFYQNICSFCLCRHETLQVEHYEPKKMSPSKIDDPNNLLLACVYCNGRSCKSDYHPLHKGRTKLKNKSFFIVDVRRDDIAKLFDLNKRTGKIFPKSGVLETQARENFVLFKFDARKMLNELRLDALENLLIFEELLIAKRKNKNKQYSKILNKKITRYASKVAKAEPFLRAFNVKMSHSAKIALSKLKYRTTAKFISQ